MNQSDFIDFLISSQFKEETKTEQQFVTRDEIQSFERETKRLLRSFLDFFVNYGLELGKHSPKSEFEELTNRLHELESDLDSDSEKGKATIKWK